MRFSCLSMVMQKEILKLTRDRIVFSTGSWEKVGKETQVEIQLPRGINLDSFSVTGMVTDCRRIIGKEETSYIVEMCPGKLPEKSKAIFDAYLNFVETEFALDKIKRNNIELKNALGNLEKKMRQIIEASTLLLQKGRSRKIIH